MAIDVGLYNRALLFAVTAHRGQLRTGSGLPYIVHPIRVAHTLWLIPDVFADKKFLVPAALLHDVVEDTGTTEEELREEFPDEVVDLVMMVTAPTTAADGGTRAERRAKDREHLAKACDSAKLLKLADMLDNLDHWENLKPDFAKVYIPEKWEALKVLKPANDLTGLYAMVEEQLRHVAGKLQIELA